VQLFGDEYPFSSMVDDAPSYKFINLRNMRLPKSYCRSTDSRYVCDMASNAP
jgi:hypothetical protein